MECTLATLIACFNLSGLYLETGLQAQDQQPTTNFVEHNKLYSGQDYYFTDVTAYSRRYSRNPYGRLAIGYEIAIKNFVWSVEALHVSSIDTSHDSGINSISVNVRWHPFKR